MLRSRLLQRLSPLAVLCALVVALPTPALAATPLTAETSLTFESSVRPILKVHCFQCHGEEDDVQGGLDVRLVRLLTKGGEGGTAIVAGDHKRSLLYERMAAGEMPPGEKKVSPKELAVIARWIDAGARTAKPEPQQVADFTDEERNFWSFQPIRRPAVPKISVQSTSQQRTPIDAFLLAELQRHNLNFSPEADRRTLIRRLYFDLIGLPPTPDEVTAFVADQSPTAYEKLVDRLLASPHYGERWGRHWLDVAGYADSEGYTPLDPVRQYAYKYRDYVIRAFNADKPWTEFIVEQLAGDELVKQPYAERTPAELEKLIATGFLRMGPDGTADSTVDQPLARNDVVAETIKIASTSLLGLSVGCAQCHNHRYDPISQVDYYRLRAIFEPAYDVKKWRAPQARLVSLMTAADRDRAAKIDAEITAINKERADELKKIVAEYFEIQVAKAPENIRQALREAHATPALKRTPEQKKLFVDYPAADVNPGSVLLFDVKRIRAFDKIYDDRIAEKKAQRPTEDFVHALTETPPAKPGDLPQTFLFFRGDHNAPRQALKPAELSVLAESHAVAIPEKDASLTSSGRRLAYARHLVDGKHPLTARVLVNRFWMHHFGRGIVASPADFGFGGERPSHPELLDWLASEFMAGGWRLKPLHRTMLLSTAYRQSSRHRAALDAVDPDNRLLGRMNVRRLEAEIIRDAMLTVSGSLSRKAFGPAVPVTPDEIGQVIIGLDNRDSAGRPKNSRASIGEEAYRRSLYIQVRRTLPLGMLETFDAPTMTPNCEVRAVSTVAPQSLLMMNNEFVTSQAELFSKRLSAAEPSELLKQISLGWQSAFGTTATDTQLKEAVEFVKSQTAQFSTPAAIKLAQELATAAGTKATNAAIQAAADKKESAPTAEMKAKIMAEAGRVARPEERALASFCQALLSANGFLYVD
jgi:hypothetical protein